jgi:hypothetical protein
MGHDFAFQLLPQAQIHQSLLGIVADRVEFRVSNGNAPHRRLEQIVKGLNSGTIPRWDDEDEFESPESHDAFGVNEAFPQQLLNFQFARRNQDVWAFTLFPNSANKHHSVVVSDAKFDACLALKLGFEPLKRHYHSARDEQVKFALKINPCFGDRKILPAA